MGTLVGGWAREDRGASRLRKGAGGETNIGAREGLRKVQPQG